MKRCQALLNTYGWSLQEDGQFGPKTEQAVRGFQSNRSITIDGVVGRLETWPELLGVR